MPHHLLLKERYKKHGGWTGLLIILETFDICGDQKLKKVSKAAKLNFYGKIFFDFQYQYFSAHINILRKLDLSRFIMQKQKFIKINSFVKKHRYDFKIDHRHGNFLKNI